MSQTQPNVPVYRMQRRAFLSRYSTGAMAVAILGPGFLAACASDGTIASATSQPGDDGESTTSATSTGASEADQEATTPAVDGDGSEFRWERVQMGFVSAYLLARGNEITIVDTGTQGNLSVFDEALTTIGASWGDVGRVIMTHAHGDHIGGLPAIANVATEATVYIGEADLVGRDAETVKDGDEIFGLQIIGTPGHTPGHISVLDPKAGFLVAGDAINESGGMVLGPNPEFTSDMTAGNASVLRLAERNFETVVFGHGEPIEGGASQAVVAFAQTLG